MSSATYMRTDSPFIKLAAHPIGRCEPAEGEQSRFADEQNDAVVGGLQSAFKKKGRRFQENLDKKSADGACGRPRMM